MTWEVQVLFGEETFAQLPERPLDLALAFRVIGLARLDGHAVMTRERQRPVVAA